MEKSKDRDGDPDNHSVTVAVSELTFGDDEMSQALNLDESTTVDPGDYLALIISWHIRRFLSKRCRRLWMCIRRTRWKETIC